nr:PREDICTED: complexin-1 [Equus przewalskii]
MKPPAALARGHRPALHTKSPTRCLSRGCSSVHMSVSSHSFHHFPEAEPLLDMGPREVTYQPTGAHTCSHTQIQPQPHFPYKPTCPAVTSSHPDTPASPDGSQTPEWATKDMGKMLGGDEEKDPDAAKKEEERQEALRQEEEERKAKYAKMEAEREAMRQGIRDKYGIKKKEEREAEAQAAMEANSEGSLTRPKKAIPPGCGDEPEEEDESILDTVIKYLPGPLQDMFKK